MLRKREYTDSFKAGMLSFGVHAALLMALLISFNWKTTHTASIAEVELWDSIPNNQVSEPLPPPPEPVVKEQPKPEPVVKEQAKPVEQEKSKEEPKVDIALEKKLQELEQKKIDDQVKKDKALEKKKQLEALQEEARRDEMRDSDKQAKAKSAKEALRKLQQDTLAEEKTAGAQQAMGAKAAANAGVIGEFTDKIKAQIRGNVNKTLCGNGNPELKFDIGLLPTGQLSGSPQLVKSSGSAACDEAVERAIIASDPLPLPSDPSLFSQFRNLKLTFRPNDGN
jgi:colicin import membrane protein